MGRDLDDKLCGIDKGVLAQTLRKYASDKLSKEPTLESLVANNKDGFEPDEKDIILAEIEMLSQDIAHGKVEVAQLDIQDAWLSTCRRVMQLTDRMGDQRYKRAVTVSIHAHDAFDALEI